MRQNRPQNPPFWGVGPCGAKKPTRHPLRRSSSTSLFGAIASKTSKTSRSNPLLILYTNPVSIAAYCRFSNPALDLAASAVVFSPRRVLRSKFSPRRVRRPKCPDLAYLLIKDRFLLKKPQNSIADHGHGADFGRILESGPKPGF